MVALRRREDCQGFLLQLRNVDLNLRPGTTAGGYKAELTFRCPGNAAFSAQKNLVMGYLEEKEWFRNTGERQWEASLIGRREEKS